MKQEYRTIRSTLRSLPTTEAVAVIKAFHLLPDEELYVIECDVWRLSIVAIAEKYSTTPETVKRRRASAYSRMTQQVSS